MWWPEVRREKGFRRNPWSVQVRGAPGAGRERLRLTISLSTSEGFAAFGRRGLGVLLGRQNPGAVEVQERLPGRTLGTLAGQCFRGALLHRKAEGGPQREEMGSGGGPEMHPPSWHLEVGVGHGG